MTTDLKPCPFCGSTDLADCHTYMVCRRCDAYGPSKHAKLDWNSRVAPAPDAARLVACATREERLRTALTDLLAAVGPIWHLSLNEMTETYLHQITERVRSNIINGRAALAPVGQAAAQPDAGTVEDPIETVFDLLAAHETDNALKVLAQIVFKMSQERHP